MQFVFVNMFKAHGLYVLQYKLHTGRIDQHYCRNFRHPGINECMCMSRNINILTSIDFDYHTQEHAHTHTQAHIHTHTIAHSYIIITVSTCTFTHTHTHTRTQSKCVQEVFLVTSTAVDSYCCQLPMHNTCTEQSHYYSVQCFFVERSSV